MSTTTTTATVKKDDDVMIDSLQETLQKIDSSLLPSVGSFVEQTMTARSSSSPSTASSGLDFLHVKNTLLLSYLIDLIVDLRDRHDTENSSNKNDETKNNNAEDDDDEEEGSHGKVEEDDDDDDDSSVEVDSTTRSNDDENDDDDEDIIHDRDTSTRFIQKRHQFLCRRKRLLEMKVVLDKIRGLDKKLRYQIDKLLSEAATSTAFVVSGRDDDDDKTGRYAASATELTEDPLQFRPDPTSLMQDIDDEDDKNDNSQDDGDTDGNDSLDETDSNDEDDEDLATARATLLMSKQSKAKTTKNANDNDDDDAAETSMVYRAPRLTAVPYTHDVQDQKLEREKRQRRRLRATELAQTLRDQYGDAPDQEDIHGGGNSDLYGKQRAASRKLAQQEAERIEYEESAMIRLTASRKVRKEKEFVERMMEGGSNLAQIANLKNLVREAEAFGRSGSNVGNDSDDDEMGAAEALEAYRKSKGKPGGGDANARHANGKRRRGPEDGVARGVENGGGRRKTMKNGRQSYSARNSLQSALYGKSSSNSKKSKKKSRR